jgi:drug/metabolite transporter (DMT)-like permease
MKTDKIISWSVFLLLTIIWGSSFILMKHSKEELTANQIAALRIFSAAVVLLPFAIAAFKKIPGKKLWIVILSGVTGNLFPAFLYAASIAKNIDSSLAGILNSLTPLFVVVLGILIFRDKIARNKMLGVLVGLLGLILLFILSKGINFENIGYASLILLATVSYGFNINMVSHYLKELNPLHVTAVSISFMIFPTAFVLWREDFLSLPFDEANMQFAIAEAVALGIVGSAIATGLFYILIKKAGGIFASLVTYTIPFMAIVWGVLDGEKVTLLQVACLGIILAGVYLTNKPENKTGEE